MTAYLGHGRSPAVLHAEPPLRAVGHSPAFQKILRLVARIAPTDHTLLITGPTGAGKEIVAQLVHQQGSRDADGRFIDINCGAIPEQLVESELFGHTRGAFTGAAAERQGYFEMAAQGTLFLDEIGEFPLSLQAKLLRVLETRTFRPVGGQEQRPFTGRIVAATHRNLEDLVRSGRFREDLYYRLAVFSIDVPGLDQRRDDIPALVHHFAARESTPPRFSAEALERLKAQPWPGNVRELRSLVSRIAVLSDETDISLGILESFLAPCTEQTLPSDALIDAVLRLDEPDKMALVERLLIDRALSLNGGSKTAAAAMLGVNRKVVERRLLAREKSRTAVDECMIAGRRMLERGEFRESAATLRRALTLLDGGNEHQPTRKLRFELHRMLAVCYRGIYGWHSPQAQAEHEAALRAGQGVVDSIELNSLMFGIWSVQLMMMQLFSARATAQDMLKLAHTTAHPAIHAEAQFALANTLFWLGDSEEALACLALSKLLDAEPAARHSAQGIDLVALAQTFAGLASFQTGALARAQRMREQLALRCTDPQASMFDRAIALQGAAWLACLFEDTQALGPMASELVQLARDHEFGFYRGVGEIFCGCHMAALGDPDPGEQRMREAYAAYFVEQGGALFHSFQAWKRAEALLAAGRAADSAALIEQALEIAQSHHERAYLSELMCVGGLAKQMLGDLDGAEDGLRSALSTAQALGSVPGRIRAATHLAELLYQDGRRRQAVSLLEKSIQDVERVVPYPALTRALQLMEQLKPRDLSVPTVGEVEHGI
ncbi:sigma-54 dependent transcriptional regulator [Duganella sp. HH105]|uniref:sigma-54-dependent transcriptional regulator n=1 Tax=Duganella sp. HH105 TaxID=1781067 RepID=UPI0008938852|nr:sigma-54 dependent transcriptional regulator [Duganella sp. HH105]OEZ63829.1 nitrogen assimilation regulatory protein [Duganella sp. HH105]